MGQEEDPHAKYRVLPPNIDIEDTVIEVETRQTPVKQNPGETGVTTAPQI